MHWYLIKLQNDQKEDWETCSSKLNSNEILKVLSENKYIKFENRCFWKKKDKKYELSEEWDNNFNNELIVKTEIVVQIVPLKNNPTEQIASGKRYKNDKKKNSNIIWR